MKTTMDAVNLNKEMQTKIDAQGMLIAHLTEERNKYKEYLQRISRGAGTMAHCSCGKLSKEALRGS